MLLQPKEQAIKTQDGTEKIFVLSKFPAIAGREIVTQYPLSALPKLGEYKTNKDIMLKIMAHVAVKTEAGELVLNSEALVNNHVPDWETLMRLEMAMMEYNCSFFKGGLVSTFSSLIKNQGMGLITKTLTDLLAQSSQKGEPRSTS